MPKTFQCRELYHFPSPHLKKKKNQTEQTTPKQSTSPKKTQTHKPTLSSGCQKLNGQFSLLRVGRDEKEKSD